MNIKFATIIITTFLLTGCPLDGTNGNVGISCWDLNENGLKDLITEDSNKDNKVDVLDCRAPFSMAPNQTVVDTTNGTITHAYTRTSAGTSDTSDSLIRLSTATLSEYNDALSNGSVSGLDIFVVEPIDDPCNLWKWTESDAGLKQLKAEDSIVYRVSHMPAITVPGNNSSQIHYGFEDCQFSCLADEQCVGAAYYLEDGTTNTLICKLLMNAGSIDQSTEYTMFEGSEQGYVAANIQSSFGVIGVTSICK